MSGSSCLLPVFSPLAVTFVRGYGVFLYDDTGRAYLDFGSGVAVTGLGHNHPALQKALTTQAAAVWHVSNWFTIPQQQRVAEILCAHSFADQVFFCNSGAEAVEAGLKIIRAYHQAHGTSRHHVIVAEKGFHGRTFGALSASGAKGYQPHLPGFIQVPYNNIDAVKAAITPETAAIFVEPVQGEGGLFPGDLTYLRALRALADQHGLLLMLDEIQTGIGRTGKVFAHQWANIRPDIVAVAKGLGGGFPVGACLVTQTVGQTMTAGAHGSTYGGNPLAMAVVEAVLTTITEDGFLTRVDRIARQLWADLCQLTTDYPSVFPTVRGAGLMLGLQCSKPNRTVMEALLARGLIVIPAGDNVIRLLPPLIITEEHVGQAVTILRAYATQEGE